MSIINKIKTLNNVKKIINTSKDIYWNSCNKCKIKFNAQRIKKLKDHCPECQIKLKPGYDRLLELMNNNKPKLKVAK